MKDKIFNLYSALNDLNCDGISCEVLKVSQEEYKKHSIPFFGITPPMLYKLVELKIGVVDEELYNYIIEFAGWKNSHKEGETRKFKIYDWEDEYVI